MEHPFNLDLQDALDSDLAYCLLPDGTWLAGGCGLLAHALARLIPGGELVVVGRLDVGIPDHLVYRFEEDGVAVYIDYNGVQTKQEVIAACREECHTASISMVSLRDLEKAGVDVSNLYWQSENDLLLAQCIERLIGEIDSERVSIQWSVEQSNST